MTLREIVASVAAEERTLVLYAPPDASSLVEEVREYVDSHNVAVVRKDPPAGEGTRAELRDRDNDTALASVSLDALRALVDPGVVRRLGESVPYAPILEALSETTFTSYDRRQMLTASREIEDRAWRQGYGSLHAGFQRLSVFADQREVYDRLGDSELDVHVYGIADTEPPEGPYTVHTEGDPELAESWFVVFDGGDQELQKCALLAQDQGEAGFYGFWTYELTLVDRILETLPAAARTVSDR
ncbi:MAG: DICT sensory domain-containing protein [Halodesulfurarchaeum sp.]